MWTFQEFSLRRSLSLLFDLRMFLFVSECKLFPVYNRLYASNAGHPTWLLRVVSTHQFAGCVRGDFVGPRGNGLFPRDDVTFGAKSKREPRNLRKTDRLGRGFVGRQTDLLIKKVCTSVVSSIFRKPRKSFQNRKPSLDVPPEGSGSSPGSCIDRFVSSLVSAGCTRKTSVQCTM